MFKRRSLQVSVVKTPRSAETESSTVTSHIHVSPKEIQDYVKTAVIAAASLYAAKVFVDTASEVVINLCPTR